MQVRFRLLHRPARQRGGDLNRLPATKGGRRIGRYRRRRRQNSACVDAGVLHQLHSERCPGVGTGSHNEATRRELGKLRSIAGVCSYMHACVYTTSQSRSNQQSKENLLTVAATAKHNCYLDHTASWGHASGPTRLTAAQPHG